MGEFQDVTLFGFGVESIDLVVTCYQVEAMSRHNPVNGGNFSKRARGRQAIGTRWPRKRLTRPGSEPQ